MELRVEGVGFGIWGFGVEGLSCRVSGAGCRIQGVGIRVWSLGLRIEV